MERRDQNPQKYKLMARYLKFAINLKKQAGLKCRQCGAKKQKTSELVCHHIIPVSKYYNYQLIMNEKIIHVLCHKCHNIIHGLNECTGANKTDAFGIGSMRILRAFEKGINSLAG